MHRTLALLFVLPLLACGSASEPATPADADRDAPSSADVLADATTDTTMNDASLDGTVTDTSDATVLSDAADAGSDAKADPLATLGACLGTSAVLTVSRQMPYVNVPVGASSGQFLVDVATTFSLIDLGAFASPKPATTGCDASKLGQSCTVDGFAFFSSPGAVTLVTADFSGVKATVRQAGIIGTDFTSLKILTLSYGGGRILASAKTGFCSDAALGAAGLSALPTTGFYSNSFATLKPMSSVDASAGSGHVPNVPTVPVRVGGASAVAQLDTGFDDALVPFSVNVNGAFFDAIQASDASALVRDAAHDLTLSTCLVGVSESVKAYTLAAGRSLDFVDGAGAIVRKYGGATLFVKTTSPKTCGGIGTWTVPAAQVAGSFFVEMGTLVFDPYSSRVWVPR
jgi:hypothetical protein